MLLTIQFINLFFHACIILNYKNLKFKLLIDKITIDLWFTQNFTSTKEIKRKYNLMINLLKFTFYKNILSGIVIIN